MVNRLEDAFQLQSASWSQLYQIQVHMYEYTDSIRKGTLKLHRVDSFPLKLCK